MRKRAFVLFLLLFALLFLACQSDDDNSDHEELVGKYWCFIGILSDEYSDTLEYYSCYDAITDNYYGAEFMLLDYSVVTYYEYDDIDGRNRTVHFDDSLFTIVYDDYSYTYKYEIVDDILYLTCCSEVTFYTIRGLYKLYTDDFPPASWDLEEIPVDDYESNDDFSSATEIVPNDTIFLLTLIEDNLDYFKFYLEEGKTYKIQGKTLGHCISHSLFDADHNLICYGQRTDSDGGEGIVFDCEYSGDYYCELTKRGPEDRYYYYFYVEEI